MADNITNKKQALTDNSVIERMVDNQLLSFIQELPDPDVILRKANIDHEVYKEILADPHVIGEVRTLRTGLLSFKHEIKAGDDTSQGQKALELCQAIFDREPHKTMRWPDLIWSIGKAPLVGRRVHHVQWEQQGSYIVPSSIFDIATSSYCFTEDGDLLIRTLAKSDGEEAQPYRWLVTRHMPERENPYGVALLSTCFWPWMFKNGGLKFFVKFCEKYGVPWPIGTYPQGTSEDDIDKLVEQLGTMIEDAVAAVPEGVDVKLLETKSSGDLPQERLANFMNREMSKALTSQSLATEIIDGGSRAAAETHSKRTDGNQKTDRSLIADTFNQLFAWITAINFGDKVKPPKFAYVDKKELNAADVDFFERAAKLVPVRKSDVYKRLEISEPGDDDEVLFLGSNPPKEPGSEAQFSRQDDDYSDIDGALSDIIDDIKSRINEGESLEDVLEHIVSLVPDLERTHSMV